MQCNCIFWMFIVFPAIKRSSPQEEQTARLSQRIKQTGCLDWLDSTLASTLAYVLHIVLCTELKNSYTATPYGVLDVFPWSIAFTLSFLSTVTQPDCYVSLSLPTASVQHFRTKTVQNSKNPTWNETFHFTIQSQVKVSMAASPNRYSYQMSNLPYSLCTLRVSLSSLTKYSYSFM